MLIIGKDNIGWFAISTSESLVIHMYIEQLTIGIIKMFPARTIEGGWIIFTSPTTEECEATMLNLCKTWKREHLARAEEIIMLEPFPPE